MSRVKTVRLKQLATQANISVERIIEFLHDKGVSEDFSPNTKILPEWHEMIMKEFSSDKDIKDKSSRIGSGRKERKSLAIDTVSNREEASSEAPAESAVEKKEATPPEPKVEEKKEEQVQAPEVKRTAPTVVGKIDLEKHAKKSPKKEEEKPKAKEEEKPVAKTEKAPEVKAEEKVVSPEEKPAEVKEEKAVEAKEEKKGNETIKARAEKLTGVTVLGKIVLPEKPKAKPAASSRDREVGRKPKRKRIQTPKVDVTKVASKNAPRTGGGANKRKRPLTQKPELTEEEIQKEIKETLARLSSKSKNKGAKIRREKRRERSEMEEIDAEIQNAEKNILKVTEFVTVSDLASLMDKTPNDIIGALMSLGIFASINQRLDAETMTIIADEFGYKVEFTTAEVTETIEVEEDKEEDLLPRAPIVTVMGHVDHGKTSLLDYIRKENVIGGEAGGITQHIGAYSVKVGDDKNITFLDTPGHEAFTAMRARGAQVTDIAIIIIAADDNVMPQTKEAINHAQAAGVPMVFAFNKVDKPDANVERLKEELAQLNILVEDWGGKFQSQEISAKTGQGIDELLEKVLLESELLELKANPNKKALGTIIESQLDKGRGYVTTILVEAGTLRVGDALLAGSFSGRVKAMHNERGSSIKEAGPSIPVSILGLNGAPRAGDRFNVMDSEPEAREIANKREQLIREQGIRTQKHITLDEIGRRIAVGEFNELNIIVKGDVGGSIEALSDSLLKLSTEKVQVNIIHKGVGQISESDVMLASASNAIIIGFQVRPSVAARNIAETEEIQIKLYSVIYAAIDDVKDAMEGMLSATVEESIVGSAEVRDTFHISRVGTIAGCFVLDGKIKRNNRIRIIRDGIVVHTGSLGSLKRFKDDAKEVTHGYECGLNIDKYNDIKVGDIIESFEENEVKQTL
jgi:translation initiation factor IF-2